MRSPEEDVGEVRGPRHFEVVIDDAVGFLNVSIETASIEAGSAKDESTEEKEE